MVTSAKKSNILKMIGNPKAIDSELKDFRRSAMVLSSQQKHLIAKYPEQWVAVYSGAVKAHGKNQKDVLRTIDELNIPRTQVIIRFITKKPRAMIL